MNKSIWLDTSDDLINDCLKKDLDLDVLIIGGGITGINCLYQLKDSDLKVALVEANRIGSGVTSKTTGKLTYLQGNYYKIYKKCGFDVSKKYYESQRYAIDVVKDIIENNCLDCDFVESDSYLYTNDYSRINYLKKEKELLEKFGCRDVINCDKLPNNDKFLYGFKCSSTYVFHPLKYLYELKKICKKNIYENSRVLSIEKDDNYYICKTNDALIRTKYVVLAVHYPSFLLPFMMPLKVTLEKSYISAVRDDGFYYSSLGDFNNECLSTRYYCNNENNYKIMLYGSRNLSDNNNEVKNFNKIVNYVSNYNYLWSNIDIITGDYIPYIGEIKDNMFLATGYNTWGMTNGILSGKVIKNLIVNGVDKNKDLFDPRRFGGGCLFKSIFSSGKAYLKEFFYSNKLWYSKNVSFEMRGNDDVGIYIDDNGVEHIIYNKCPHMKCGLIFNEIEKTWECPCHGSRFNIDGVVIEGPSNYNITYKSKDS